MTVELSPEAREARITLAETVDTCHAISEWYTSNATGALRKLQERWHTLCSQEGKELSEGFSEECEDILADCEVLRSMILEKTEDFADTASRRLPLLNDLAPNDDGVQQCTRAFFDGWNESTQPQAVRLYECVEKLEDSIRDTTDVMGQEGSG